jgi:cytochrome bd-type quinol oxidase subunit 1
MRQNVPPLSDIPPTTESHALVDASQIEVTPERMATVWVGRMTFLVGGICLMAAFAVWLLRPGHYRLVLAFLIVAMFMAILHSYTFENGGGP